MIHKEVEKVEMRNIFVRDYSKIFRTGLAIPQSNAKPETDFSIAGYVKSQRTEF
jgi:hypothetical protein